MAWPRKLAALVRDPWLGRWAFLSSAVLVVLIGHQLALIFLSVTESDAGVVPDSISARVQQESGDPQRVASRHLFGRADSETRPVAVDVPETRLNLTLRGIASGSGEQSRALIAGPDGREQVYAVGASVPGGATVHEILADRVLLNRRGTLETLRLPRHGSSPSAGAPAAAMPVAATTTRAVDNLQQQGDADALSEVIRPQAVLMGGRLHGYRIYPGRDRQRFASLGLRAGDLVTAINGIPLEDPTTSLEALQAIAGTEQVTLTVERGGQVESLVLRLER